MKIARKEIIEALVDNAMDVPIGQILLRHEQLLTQIFDALDDETLRTRFQELQEENGNIYNFYNYK